MTKTCATLKSCLHPPLKVAFPLGMILTLVVILTLFVFEAYVLTVNHTYCIAAV